MGLRTALKQLSSRTFRSDDDAPSEISKSDPVKEFPAPSPFGKAAPEDFPGRFREIVSDPLNLLIERVPESGYVENGIVCLHNGNRVAMSGEFAYYGGFSDILVINRGVHEPLEEYVFQELLRLMPEAPTMLELGAYWGHYSMWLKRARPQANVTLVEPDAHNLLVGRANFDRNGYEGTFLQSFVGHGQFEMDAYIAERKHPHVDILHCDIQGYEAEMLGGCAESFRLELVDYLFVSTHSQELHEQVISKLGEMGMRVEVSSGFDVETTSFDGFVFASRSSLPAVFAGFKPMGRPDISGSEPKELVSYISSQFERQLQR